MSTPNMNKTYTVTIANGASLSDSSGLFEGAYRLVGYMLDSAWDTNAISFQGSADGSTFANVYDEASEYSQAGVTASSYHSVKVDAFLPLRALKVRSGTAAAAVNQAGATVITLFCLAI